MKPPPISVRVRDPELYQWLKDLWSVLESNIVSHDSQNAAPSNLRKNAIRLWTDADGGPAYYLVADFNGTQKKVALT